MKRWSWVLGAVVLALAIGVGLWFASTGDDDDSIADTVRFDFDDSPLTSTDGSKVEVSAEQVSAGGGEVTSGPSYPGAGQAAVFPEFDGDRDGARAVLAVTADDPEALSPGEAPFRFGADVLLSEPNQGSEFDNGNNVLQRGLFGMGAQFKLQIDKGVASCRVEGDAGGVTAKSSAPIETGTWQSVTCARDGDSVRVTVSPVDGDPGDPVTDEESGSIGAVDLPDDAPLSMGGKLDRNLSIEEESDQFNGSLDNVFVAIG
ncbi:LamG domain-containing protein [Nocardioides sp.]|uniref:LamG domain-containing protein n=1 Tax=Nocardioides sp. TaxID=35761 RepID=UPI003D0B6A05